MMKMLLPILACSLLIGGCSEENFADEAKPTITQGVWGRIIAGCDTEDCESEPVEGATVHAEPLMGTVGPGGSSKTTDEGMYQIELSPGEYHLSHSPDVEETDVTVPVGLVECTWVSGPGGGDWTCR